jgi:hypothetical protein
VADILIEYLLMNAHGRWIFARMTTLALVETLVIRLKDLVRVMRVSFASWNTNFMMQSRFD